MAEAFFTSDLHLGHPQILNHANRPFADVAQMNHVLINNINATVGMKDTLYLLGDVAFRIPKEDAAKLLAEIRCRNLYLVVGNHDHHYEDTGLFKEIRIYREQKIEGLPSRTVLFHYPIAEWNRYYQGAIHLHGHIHSKGPTYNIANFEKHHYAFDVGVDANGYRPVSASEIADLWKLTQ
jgi:calcineurin-like phosphoesterase family protein